MAGLGLLVLGVHDVDRAAAFWSQVGYQRMRGGFGGCATVLAPPPGAPGAKIALQRSETPPQDHPQLHLDLHAKDATEQEAEAARLSALGAERVDWDSCPAHRDFVVLADPEGDPLEGRQPTALDGEHGRGAAHRPRVPACRPAQRRRRPESWGNPLGGSRRPLLASRSPCERPRRWYP